MEEPSSEHCLSLQSFTLVSQNQLITSEKNTAIFFTFYKKTLLYQIPFYYYYSCYSLTLAWSQQ